MAFDFKKEYKEYYAPKNKPGIVWAFFGTPAIVLATIQ